MHNFTIDHVIRICEAWRNMSTAARNQCRLIANNPDKMGRVNHPTEIINFLKELQAWAEFDTAQDHASLYAQRLIDGLNVAFPSAEDEIPEVDKLTLTL